MKKQLIATIAILLILTATACAKGNDIHNPTPTTSNMIETTSKTQPTAEFETKEHLELTTNTLPLDSLWLTEDLDKVGLTRISKSVKGQGFITEKSKSETDIRTVALLCDYDRYESSLYHDLFLAVEADTKVIYKDLTYNRTPGAYSENLYLNDIDGDGTDEIILHQCVGITGGAGQYLARIFKVENEEIKELFNSLTKTEDNGYWDTGFNGSPIDNWTFKISNSITGFSETYADNPERLDRYNENGEAISSLGIMVDSFNVFLPKDIDNDGICEIYCEQYTSHKGHADYTGEAISILKYNTEIQEFEVVDAKFEPVETLK